MWRIFLYADSTRSGFPTTEVRTKRSVLWLMQHPLLEHGLPLESLGFF